MAFRGWGLYLGLMIVEQFEDKGLAHYSYLLISEADKKAVAIDPARDAAPYLAYLAARGARLVAVIETHPHADFVSSHAELQRVTGADILCSRALQPAYDFVGFDEGDSLTLADFTLRPLNTPGHSPDSISVLLSVAACEKVLFSGDTLFIGDVGRPDLRKRVGAAQLSGEELAAMMYETVQTRLLPLADDVIVYPAHGAGSLCGKALSTANASTIGQERLTNPALQPMDKAAFTAMLLADQPFVPKYFGACVELNRQGAPDMEAALTAVPRRDALLGNESLLIDTRNGESFKQGHTEGAINLQAGGKFETWLGAIVNPGETFTLLGADAATLERLLRRTAYIGYEAQVTALVVQQEAGHAILPTVDVQAFTSNPEHYTVLDVRNRGEAAGKPIFSHAQLIPLPELRERVAEVPVGKPVMVHCAAGYRSAAAVSILAAARPELEVFDLGEAIRQFD